MRLSPMPKALGFSYQTKSYFPPGFSSEEHLKYIGPFPHCVTMVECMTPHGQVEFYSWYRKESQGTLNFERKALHSCKNDVNIFSED